MPLYAYHCPECNARTERREPITFDDPVPCPECGSDMVRTIGPVTVFWRGGSPSSGQWEKRDKDEYTTQNFLKGRGYRGRPERPKKWAT